MAKTLTNEVVFKATVDLFIETGKDSTATEIAAKIGCKSAAVSAIFRENHGLIPGLRVDEEYRASYSKNYPSMQTGAHKVFVYGPTRDTLREMLIKSAATPAAAPGPTADEVEGYYSK